MIEIHEWTNEKIKNEVVLIINFWNKRLLY
jgi:hypothetical protein